MKQREDRDTAAGSSVGLRGELVVIFLISLAGLLLEISYTRVFSFKLSSYFTYLIIGFAMLGIGAGGVFVALFRQLRQAALRGRPVQPQVLAVGGVRDLSGDIAAVVMVASDRVCGSRTCEAEADGKRKATQTRD